MAQHFLLTAAARTISIVQVARMGEDEAFALFRAMRWHATGGDPVCPACGCAACYEYHTRRLFKCKACGKQFSVTSGTTNLLRPHLTVPAPSLLRQGVGYSHRRLVVSRKTSWLPK